MGDRDFSQIQALVDRPTESLSIELKRWIDPDQPEGQAKIVKAALALRNYGGGYLIIGFGDNTHEPDQANIPQDVKTAFHIDKIQDLISRYASEPFEVSVEFPEREGQPYPVLIVPPGVKTPVAAKADLQSDNGRKLISVNDVYIRSLLANNTPSTTKATWKDWPNILGECFDNREADIGRFLRRHLGGLPSEVVHEFLGSIASGSQLKETTEEHLQKSLQESKERYSTIVEERGVKLPPHGAWEVGLLLIGDIPSHSANKVFLNLLNTSNPHYTGWPVWLDSRDFPDKSERPYVFENTWESFIFIQGGNWYDSIDFMRLDPKGQFYLRQAFYEDMRDLEPMKYLDFALPIKKVAEAIAVGIAFAKAMGCDPEETQLAFNFRWTGLKGRKLVPWIEPNYNSRAIGVAYQDIGAYQDEVPAFVKVPLETPLSALGEFVDQTIKPLFHVFNGSELRKDVVEDLTRKTIERKL